MGLASHPSETLRALPQAPPSLQRPGPKASFIFIHQVLSEQLLCARHCSRRRGDAGGLLSPWHGGSLCSLLVQPVFPWTWGNTATDSQHQGPREPQNPLPSSASSANWQSVFLLDTSGPCPFLPTLTVTVRSRPHMLPLLLEFLLVSIPWGIPCVAASTLPPVVRDFCLKGASDHASPHPAPTPNALLPGFPVAFRIKVELQDTDTCPSVIHSGQWSHLCLSPLPHTLHSSRYHIPWTHPNIL